MKGIYLYIILVCVVLTRNNPTYNTSYLGISDDDLKEIVELSGLNDYEFIDMDVDNDNDKLKFLRLLPSFNFFNVKEHYEFIFYFDVLFLVPFYLLNQYIDLPPPNKSFNIVY